MKTSKTAIVYIDGFNLYRRLVENTSYKWLNLASMCDTLLPEFSVIKIKYFTARVSAPPHDPDQQIRQETYFRALKTENRIELIFGKFENRPKKYPSHPWEYDQSGEPLKSKIIFMKEKGSDVNLAAHLISDAYQNHANAYIVVTNDSDQTIPISILLEQKLGVIGLMVPDNAPSKRLMALPVNIKKRIRKGVLASSQFSGILHDAHGEIHKPSGW